MHVQWVADYQSPTSYQRESYKINFGGHAKILKLKTQLESFAIESVKKDQAENAKNGKPILGILTTLSILSFSELAPLS